MNMMKTGILMAAMTALFLAIGYALGRETGMVMALAFAIATNVFAYWNADKMVLRMAGAREAGPSDLPEFHRLIGRLARNAGLPMPKVYVIDSGQPNAFATGRNPANAAVAATTGLLRTLSPDEIEGVMAHELAHVKNRDTLIMAMTATISGAIAMLANFGFLFGGRDRNAPGSSRASTIRRSPTRSLRLIRHRSINSRSISTIAKAPRPRIPAFPRPCSRSRFPCRRWAGPG